MCAELVDSWMPPLWSQKVGPNFSVLMVLLQCERVVTQCPSEGWTLMMLFRCSAWSTFHRIKWRLIYSAINLVRITPAPFNTNMQTVAGDPLANVELKVTVGNLSTTLDPALQRITSLENTILPYTVLPPMSTVAITQKSSASNANPQLQSSGTSNSTVIKSPAFRRPVLAGQKWRVVQYSSDWHQRQTESD